MSNLTKEDLILGIKLIPEYYNEIIFLDLTKKQKRKIFINQVIGIIKNILFYFIMSFGILLQVYGIVGLYGIFF